jgi:N-methylhydantoinase A/oxoprolinase/acetone carboxylase beta subunit
MEGQIDFKQLRQELQTLKEEGRVTSLAIVLMHSYAFPE